MTDTRAELLRPPFHTPDIGVLEDQKRHLVFDCGPIRPVKELVSAAYTAQRMTLYIDRFNNEPVPIFLDGEHRAKIAGALYVVPTAELVELDKQRQNRLIYERRRISVLLPFPDENGNVDVLRDGKGKEQQVWAYTAIVDAWAEQIDMYRPRYNIPPQNALIVRAKTYVDNISHLNNHYRFAPMRVEDLLLKPKPKVAGPDMIAYVRQKNAEALRKPILRRLQDRLQRFNEQQGLRSL
jgi:hypothetical protein